VCMRRRKEKYGVAIYALLGYRRSHSYLLLASADPCLLATRLSCRVPLVPPAPRAACPSCRLPLSCRLSLVPPAPRAACPSCRLPLSCRVPSYRVPQGRPTRFRCRVYLARRSIATACGVRTTWCGARLLLRRHLVRYSCTCTLFSFLMSHWTEITRPLFLHSAPNIPPSTPKRTHHAPPVSPLQARNSLARICIAVLPTGTSLLSGLH